MNSQTPLLPLSCSRSDRQRQRHHVYRRGDQNRNDPEDGAESRVPEVQGDEKENGVRAGEAERAEKANRQ